MDHSVAEGDGIVVSLCLDVQWLAKRFKYEAAY